MLFVSKSLSFSVALLLSGSILSAPARADEEIKFGPAPDWVVEQPVSSPQQRDLPDPYMLLLDDNQYRYDDSSAHRYFRRVFEIGNTQGLANSAISIEWDPLQEDVIIHKLVIHRGDQVIDIIADGQTFTTLRRETSLEEATLDGRLTASMQPEGVEVGDRVEYEVSIIEKNEVTGGHASNIVYFQSPGDHGKRHIRLLVPAKRELALKEWPGAIKPVIKKAGDYKSYDWTISKMEDLKAPNGAPGRYQIGRVTEFSDFDSWDAVSDLMRDHFSAAEVVTPGGRLEQEIDKIAAASDDPVERAEAALQLVQNRIRYVNLALGAGGLVPADAETTWKRRFGDCKGKTVLLLTVLHRLGIDAVPALVYSSGDDALDVRLPMIRQFDHVLVKADIGGKTYWLDGTRAGDKKLAQVAVPDMGYALPLVDNAQLVKLDIPPKTVPDLEMEVTLDLSAGLEQDMKGSMVMLLGGDAATGAQQNWNQMKEALEKRMEDSVPYGDSDNVKMTLTGHEYREATNQFAIIFDFAGKPNFYSEQLDGSFVTPDFIEAEERDKEEVDFNLDAPFALQHPSYSRVRQTIILPEDAPDLVALVGEDRHYEMLGEEYDRKVSLDGNRIIVDTASRSLSGQVPYQEALDRKEEAEVANRDQSYFRLNLWYSSPVAIEAMIERTNAMDEEKLSDDARKNVLRFLRNQLALSLARAGEADKAAQLFDELRGEAKDAIALNELCWAKAVANIALDRALEECNASVGFGRLTQNLDSRGLVHLRIGEWDKALADFSGAVELADEDSGSHYLYGRSLANRLMGNIEAAKADADKALALEPNMDSLYRAYGLKFDAETAPSSNQ